MIASLAARRGLVAGAGAATGTGTGDAAPGVCVNGVGGGVELNQFVRIVHTPFDGMLVSAAPRPQAPDAESISQTSGSLLDDCARDSPPGALFLEDIGGAGASSGVSSLPHPRTASSIGSLTLRVDPAAANAAVPSAADGAKADLMLLHPSGDLAEPSPQAAAATRPEPASATTGYDSDDEQQQRANTSTSANPSAKKAGAPRSASAHSRSSERSASPASSPATDEDGDTTASESRSHSGNEEEHEEAGDDEHVAHRNRSQNPEKTPTASPASPTKNGLGVGHADEIDGRKRKSREKSSSAEPENDLGSDFIDDLKSSATQPAPLLVKKHHSKYDFAILYSILLKLVHFTYEIRSEFIHISYSAW